MYSPGAKSILTTIAFHLTGLVFPSLAPRIKEPSPKESASHLSQAIPQPPPPFVSSSSSPGFVAINQDAKTLIRSLLESLGSDPNTIQELGYIGQKAVPQIIRFLQNNISDSAKFSAAIQALSLTESPMAAQSLAEIVLNRDGLYSVSQRVDALQHCRKTAVYSVNYHIFADILVKSTTPLELALPLLEVVHQSSKMHVIKDLILRKDLPDELRSAACYLIRGEALDDSETQSMKNLLAHLKEAGAPKANLAVAVQSMLEIGGYLKKPVDQELTDLYRELRVEDSWGLFGNAPQVVADLMDKLQSGKSNAAQQAEIKDSLVTIMLSAGQDSYGYSSLPIILGEYGANWAIPGMICIFEGKVTPPESSYRSRALEGLISMLSHKLSPDDREEIVSAMVTFLDEPLSRSDAITIHSMMRDDILSNAASINDPRLTQKCWETLDNADHFWIMINRDEMLKFLVKLDRSRVIEFFASNLEDGKDWRKSSCLDYLKVLSPETAASFHRQVLLETDPSNDLDIRLFEKAFQDLCDSDSTAAISLARDIITGKSDDHRNQYRFQLAAEVAARFRQTDLLPFVLERASKTGALDDRFGYLISFRSFGHLSAVPLIARWFQEADSSKIFFATECLETISALLKDQSEELINNSVHENKLHEIFTQSKWPTPMKWHFLEALISIDNPTLNLAEYHYFSPLVDTATHISHSLARVVYFRNKQFVPEKLFSDFDSSPSTLTLLNSRLSDKIQYAAYLLESPVEFYLKLEATEALANSTDSLSSAILEDLLDSPYEPLQVAAASALSTSRHKRAEKILGGYLGYHRYFEQAFSALSQNGSSSAINKILELLERPETLTPFHRIEFEEFLKADSSLIENFIGRLEKAGQDATNFEEASILLKYAKSLARSKELEIDRPFRLTPSTLIEIVDNRSNITSLSGNNILVIASKTDYNGALYAFPLSLKSLCEHYEVLYFETWTDTGVVKITETLRDAGIVVSDIYLVGHASPGAISFGGSDPRGSEENHETLELDLSDEEQLRASPLNDILSPGGNIVVIGCSAGALDSRLQGKGNVSRMLRRVTPNAKQVLAANRPFRLDELELFISPQHSLDSLRLSGKRITPQEQ